MVYLYHWEPNANSGKPMLTLHGTLDALLPIAVDSDVYAGMVRNTQQYRYYRVSGGLHVEGIVPNYPGVARTMLPCYRSAFEAMERWIAGRGAPPPSATLPYSDSGTCSL